jgi:pimeloyl-ACP methyl ester carboxylesterase
VLQAVYPDIRRAIRNRISGVLGGAPALLLEPLLSYQSRLRLGVWPARLSPLRAIAGFKGAVLVIGGGQDGHTPPHETLALYRAAPGPKAMWIVPAVDHKQTSELQGKEYRERLLAFFARTLGGP